jgi:hypothetical protein
VQDDAEGRTAEEHAVEAAIVARAPHAQFATVEHGQERRRCVLLPTSTYVVCRLPVAW